MSKIFINCDEATTICDKNQYKEASFFERMQLSLHLLTCKKCGMYTRQNTTVTKVCNQHLKKEVCDCNFTDAEKDTLQTKISEKLNQ